MTLLLMHVFRNKKILALADVYGRIMEHEIIKKSHDDNYREMIESFLSRHPTSYPDYACIAFSGDVSELSHENAQLLKAQLHLEEIVTVKDSVAQAYSLHLLRKNQLKTLQKGEPLKGGTLSFISIGENVLGESALAYPDTIIDSKGGSCDFLPQNELEYLLYRFVKDRKDTVFYHDILSEAGLLLICEFLEKQLHYEVPSSFYEILHCHPSSVTEILRLGASRKTPLYFSSISIFLKILGAKTRNHLLQFGSTGGVFLYGDLLLGMKRRLVQDVAFKEGFYRKDSSDQNVADIPVHLINDLLSTLYGAHCYFFEKISS